MTRRTRVGRLAWFFAALLQLLVPTVWSVADARAEAVSARTATLHVEAPGSTACARVHPADCAVCRVLAMSSLPSAPAPVLVPSVSCIGATLAAVARHWATARAAGDPPQRAPPV